MRPFQPTCSPAVPAAWSAWSTWSSCSTSCGPGVSPGLYPLLQVRTRVQACDPAQHGGSSEACSEDQTESEDCTNSCCEWCTFKTLFKVKWTANGALGVRGPPARLAVPPGWRGGAGPAGTTAPPAGETRVAAPLINQGCATHLTAVSDHLRHTL